MDLLYLNYGAQSGVTASLLSRLRQHARVSVYNPFEAVHYKRRWGAMQVPNVRPEVVRAVLHAVALHGRYWKPYYLHSPYMFDLLTERAEAAIHRYQPEVVLQAGVLFAPGRAHGVPCYLYLDHTRAIAERYARAEGLLPPIAYHAQWREREEDTYHRARAVFTMSRYVARSLEEDYGVDPRRVHVVGAGPNVVPGPSPVPEERHCKTFLFVGVRWHYKGGPTLLEAFARVRQRHPEARLWVASSYRPDTPVPGVTFHGLLGHGALARLYATAHCFVLPTPREAFGLSFLEAMGFGLPCIGSDIEAIPEMIVPGETGWLVPPGDVEALARAMLECLEHPLEAQAMGLAGRRRSARFGWDLAVQRILEVMGDEQRAGGGAEPGLHGG